MNRTRRFSAAGRRSFRRKATERSAVTRASERPTPRDLGWLAGFMEGEGSFARVGLGYGSERVQVPQCNPEPLHRMVRLLGGSIRLFYKGDGRRSDAHVWYATGARARGIMQTIYPLMTAKRQAQIRAAFVEPPPVQDTDQLEWGEL